MTRAFFSLLLTLTSLLINAKITPIYSKAYGDAVNFPIIFIHGGPSGNSTLFEATTAQKLADNGFYVITYDRRGEGRSVDSSATFTYQEAIDDLKEVYKTYNIKKANLIAHSFGGLVATFFAEQNPEKINTLVLAGALFSQQDTYNHILNSVKKSAQNKKDYLMLSRIVEIEKLNQNSADYRKNCFEIASQYNYFKMPFPTNQAKKLREHYEQSIFFTNNIRNNNAPILFYQNEIKKNIDVKPILKELKKKVKIFAIYGKQDNIFSKKQLNDLKKIVTRKNFKTIDNCSHYLFVDQQQTFIESIKKWIK